MFSYRMLFVYLFVYLFIYQRLRAKRPQVTFHKLYGKAKTKRDFSLLLPSVLVSPIYFINILPLLFATRKSS